MVGLFATARPETRGVKLNQISVCIGKQAQELASLRLGFAAA